MRLEIIGDLKGVKVMIDRDDRSVILAHDDMPPIRFSIDHPYIQGTKLEREVRAALDSVTSKSTPYKEKTHALRSDP